MSSVPLSSRIIAPNQLDLPEPVADVTWRSATIDDCQGIHLCERAIAVADHPRHAMSLEAVREKLEAHYVDLTADTVVATDAHGVIRAWGAAVLLPSQVTLVRCRLLGGVDPEFRGRGIGRALLGWLRDRGLQRLASTSSTLPGWLVVPVDGDADATQRLCERLQFERARIFLELKRPLVASVNQVPLDGLTIEEFTPTRSKAAQQADNDAFRDHWSSQPTTDDEWRALVEGSTFRADLSFVAVATDDEGEQVAGLIMSNVSEEDFADRGYRFVYIGIVGVARGWRRRGVAAALLNRALQAAADAGLEAAILDVDAQNPSGALGFYERQGFKRNASTFTYTSVY